MIDCRTLDLIKEKIEYIIKQGHGEVVVKIKNGVVYRVLTAEDQLLKK